MAAVSSCLFPPPVPLAVSSCIYLSIYLAFYLAFYLSIYLSVSSPPGVFSYSSSFPSRSRVAPWLLPPPLRLKAPRGCDPAGVSPGMEALQSNGWCLWKDASQGDAPPGGVRPGNVP